MTPKKQAELIFQKMFDVRPYHTYSSKKCSVIAIKLIIASNPHSNPLNSDGKSTMEYWNEVLKEAEQL